MLSVPLRTLIGFLLRVGFTTASDDFDDTYLSIAHERSYVGAALAETVGAALTELVNPKRLLFLFVYLFFRPRSRWLVRTWC